MNTVLLLRWAAGGVLAAAALWLSLLNWIALVRRFSPSGSASWIPLLGGALGVAAILLVPPPIFATAWWVPLVVDAGCLPGFAVTLIWLLVRHPSRPNPP